MRNKMTQKTLLQPIAKWSITSLEASSYMKYDTLSLFDKFFFFISTNNPVIAQENGDNIQCDPMRW